MPFAKVGMTVALAAVLGGLRPALASITATASVSTSQSSAPFDYTVTLHNTGDTNIGTFWFAWTAVPRSYDFLPTLPTNISGPSGWIFPVSNNPTPGDGYGIEWYNVGGSAIAPGGVGTFTLPRTTRRRLWRVRRSSRRSRS